MSLTRLGDSPRYVLSLGDRVIEVLVEEESQGFNVHIGGRAYEIATARSRSGRPRSGESDNFENGRWLMRSPITGVVIERRTAAGEPVAVGQVLFVIEAMKMLNELRSRVEGIVSVVHAGQGDRVELGDPLVEVTPLLEPGPSP